MWLPWELPSVGNQHGLYRENTLLRQRVLSSLSRPTLLVFGPLNGKKIISIQRFLTFPKPVSLPTVLFFQNDQASSICCPFPNKLSWFRLQRPQNPALLAIPGCKLLPLLLGSHSSQESGYTSQHQEEEFKTLATLFRLVLVGGDTKKILLWKKTL